MHNLPEPYGDSEEKDPVAVSQCQLDCEAERVEQICGCVDVHMEPPKNGMSTKPAQTQTQTQSNVLFKTKHNLLQVQHVTCGANLLVFRTNLTVSTQNNLWNICSVLQVIIFRPLLFSQTP